MFITGLGSATPPQRFTQEECWATLQPSPEFAGLTSRSRAILRKVFLGDNGIEARHLTYQNLAEAFDLTPDALHQRFATHAPALATAAAQNALTDAGLTPGDIDAVLISTCTGYLCPGLTSYVAERLGLRSDVWLLDLVGQGCGAAIPNMRTAESLIRSGQSRRVLCVCVEICSAAFYLDNDPGVLVSACLFGDGAAAAIVDRDPQPGRRRVEWMDAETLLAPGDRELLRFDHRGGMLRNILSLEVPAVAAKYARAVLEKFLERRGMKSSDLQGWILHAGGRNVLAALRTELGLAETDLRHSSDILREFGNLSSPFVFFVLQAALQQNQPGGLWWMASFGAGFSSHGTLLRVE